MVSDMKPYIRVVNKRLFNGYLFDVRSHIVERAIEKGLYIKGYVQNTGRYITIPNIKLKEGIYGTKLYKSKQREGKDYYLVSFSVRSDTEKQEEKQKEKEPQQISILKNPKMLKIISKVIKNGKFRRYNTA